VRRPPAGSAAVGSCPPFSAPRLPRPAAPPPCCSTALFQPRLPPRSPASLRPGSITRRSPIVPPRPDIAAFAPSSACARSSTSTCGLAKAQARRSASRFFARLSPATSAWPPSLRQGSMNGTEVALPRLIELAAAFACLTRLPAHRLSLPRRAVQSQAVWSYPLVGPTVGAIGGAAYWLLQSLSCPSVLSALCALIAMILATGAMHEDGLADFADGLAAHSN